MKLQALVAKAVGMAGLGATCDAAIESHFQHCSGTSDNAARTEEGSTDRRQQSWRGSQHGDAIHAGAAVVMDEMAPMEAKLLRIVALVKNAKYHLPLVRVGANKCESGSARLLLPHHACPRPRPRLTWLRSHGCRCSPPGLVQFRPAGGHSSPCLERMVSRVPAIIFSKV